MHLVTLDVLNIQESEPIEAVRLHAGGGLSEDSLSESESRNKRYSKAMTLKGPGSAAAIESEETQSLLQFRDITEDKLSRFQRLWFAAETEKQHLDWHSKLIDTQQL